MYNTKERPPIKGPKAKIKLKYVRSFVEYIEKSPLLNITIVSLPNVFRVWYAFHDNINNSKEVMESSLMAKLGHWKV